MSSWQPTKLKRAIQLRLSQVKIKVEGKVASVKDGKLIIEGINQVTKHTKPSQTNPQGGIVQQSAPIDASNVMYVSKGKASRVGFKVEDGKKVRYAKATGEVID